MYSLKEKEEDTSHDSDVINKIIEGDKGFFEILIRRNNPFLYKTGRSYGFNHQDTQDLMQEAFTAAYLNLNQFRHQSSFKTWIIQIMLNLCYHKTRKLSFRNEKPADAIFHEKHTPMFSTEMQLDAHRTILGKELNHIIETTLNQIPVEYRMVFSLRELSGLSTSETAKVLAITETNVKVRLNRAKHMLRKKVEGIYSPADIFEFNLVYCDELTNRVMHAIMKLP